MSDELRSEFHVQLSDIQLGIARMAAGVTELIPRATEILLMMDLEGAEYMILGDEEYDKRALDLEERCFKVIALQAPVAGDLRRRRRRRSRSSPTSSARPICASTSARRPAGSTATNSIRHLRGVIQKMGDQAQVLFKESHRGVSQPRWRPRRRAARHGHLPGRPAAPVHPGDLREPRCREHRPPGRACNSPWWRGSTNASAIMPSTSVIALGTSSTDGCRITRTRRATTIRRRCRWSPSLTTAET